DARQRARRGPSAARARAGNHLRRRRRIARTVRQLRACGYDRNRELYAERRELGRVERALRHRGRAPYLLSRRACRPVHVEQNATHAGGRRRLAQPATRALLPTGAVGTPARVVWPGLAAAEPLAAPSRTQTVGGGRARMD